MGFLIFLGALAIAVLGLGLWGTNFACRRHSEPNWADPEEMKKTGREQFIPDIHAAIAWLERNRKEDWYRVSKDGLKLHAHWCPVEGAKGTLILFHGYRGSYYLDFSKILHQYHRMGYHLLVVDQRSHGLSEGKYITFGVRESEDAILWIHAVNSRCGEDHPVFLDGLSMGSTTVLMALGRGVTPNVRGCIADCGFTSPWDEIGHCIRRWYHVPPTPVLWIMYPFFKLIAGFGLKEYSTVEALKNNRVPLLMLHGLGDNFVPSWMSQRAFDANPGEKNLILVEGADHGLSYVTDEARCQSALEEFLNQYNSVSVKEAEQ